MDFQVMYESTDRKAQVSEAKSGLLLLHLSGKLGSPRESLLVSFWWLWVLITNTWGSGQ